MRIEPPTRIEVLTVFYLVLDRIQLEGRQPTPGERTCLALAYERLEADATAEAMTVLRAEKAMSSMQLPSTPIRWLDDWRRLLDDLPR